MTGGPLMASCLGWGGAARARQPAPHPLRFPRRPRGPGRPRADGRRRGGRGRLGARGDGDGRRRRGCRRRRRGGGGGGRAGGGWRGCRHRADAAPCAFLARAAGRDSAARGGAGGGVWRGHDAAALPAAAARDVAAAGAADAARARLPPRRDVRPDGHVAHPRRPVQAGRRELRRVRGRVPQDGRSRARNLHSHRAALLPQAARQRPARLAPLVQGGSPPHRRRQLLARTLRFAPAARRLGRRLGRLRRRRRRLAAAAVERLRR
mmetsp:Transcript_1535/g.5187  ORF Transcript_1535/g.5187 Transcript_1535/m.5187 type:complete len:264 (-) Transcript_1535:55-846(-)